MNENYLWSLLGVVKPLKVYPYFTDLNTEAMKEDLFVAPQGLRVEPSYNLTPN